MIQKPRAELRNATEKEVGAIRKDAQQFNAFVKKWCDGLKREGAAWDGQRAVAELKRKGMFEFLLGKGTAQSNRTTRHLFGRMFYELQNYEKELTERPVKERLGRVEDFLERMGTTLQAEERLANSREIKEILKRLGADVDQARGAVAWSKFKQEKLHFGFSQEILWPEAPRRSLASRRVELDTRLQIELGKVLLFYLRQKNISLETVARLILLAYWAGNLSEPFADFSRSRLTGRILKARNVRENLRDAKLHEAVGFSPERTPALMAELKRARKILGPAASGLGVLPLLYLSKTATRFRLTKEQIASLIRPGVRVRAERGAS